VNLKQDRTDTSRKVVKKRGKETNQAFIIICLVFPCLRLVLAQKSAPKYLPKERPIRLGAPVIFKPRLPLLPLRCARSPTTSQPDTQIPLHTRSRTTPAGTTCQKSQRLPARIVRGNNLGILKRMNKIMSKADVPRLK
jgi:hypothetical protein